MHTRSVRDIQRASLSWRPSIASARLQSPYENPIRKLHIVQLFSCIELHSVQCEAMNSTTRPAAHLIRFDAECFAQVGTREAFIVSNPNGWGYPARFENREQAEACAKLRNHTLRVVVEPVVERVKWF